MVSTPGPAEPLAIASSSEQAGPEAPKLSNAELKKRAKAEKQAKRAARKVETAPSDDFSIQQQQGVQRGKQSGPSPAGSSHQQKSKGQLKQPRTGASTSPAGPEPSTQKLNTRGATTPQDNRVFKHFTSQRRMLLEGAHKDVHPAVLAYGLQTSSYQICGSTARCLGMLKVFKELIRSYSIPPDNALARHFIPHLLSPQIEFIKSCRPISVGMGNAIRHFKDAIVKIDPETSETEAKDTLHSMIDNFIRERITAADTVIAEEACKKIDSGDIVLTFAKSSVVDKTFRRALKLNKKFKVIVVDSKPLYEGQRFAQNLEAMGVDVEYYMISGINHAMGQATKVIVGAHAMLSDGRLHSRIGTASVAQLARESNVPVIVCCESYKFSEKIYVDSFGGNELAPPEELLEDDKERDAWSQQMSKTPLLQMINMMYDLTPAEYVSMIVTELGPLPPSSVPAVLRMLEGRAAA